MMDTTTIATAVASNITKEVEKICDSSVLQHQPSFKEFLDILGVAGALLVTVATIAFLILIALYANTAWYIVRFAHPRHKANTLFVLTVYPVLGLCSYLGLLFQKANVFLNNFALVWFAICMWQFLLLTIKYFGGETRWAAKMEGTVLPWKNPPCCCWPCCVCFPKNPVTKRQIRMIKIVVMQHPWVQLIILVFQMTLYLEGWYNSADLQPSSSYIYITIISMTSFFFGVWGFIVGFKASLSQLQEFHYLPKLVSFHLCVLFLRFQRFIVISILLPSGAIPCLPPISPRVFANTLLNALLLGEMVVVSVLARNFYRRSTPDIVTIQQEDDKRQPGELEKDANLNGRLITSQP